MSCCSGHWNNRCYKGKKMFCIKAHPASLSGDLCYWLGARPLFTTERRGGPGPSPSVLSFFLTPQSSEGPSAFPLLGRLGIGCFYKMNMTQKSIQHDQLVHLKESSAGLPIMECLSCCLLRHSLYQRTRSLPGSQ